MRIYIAGSCAFDRIMDFPGYFKDWILPDKIHMLNVSFPIDTLAVRHGGTGGNIAYSLALLGEKPFLIASAGNDFASYGDVLRQHGVQLDHVELHADVPTAHAHIITDRSDNQLCGFYFGAMARQTAYDLSLCDPFQTLLHIAPTHTGDMLRLARLARARGIRTIIDPGQQIPSLSKKELSDLIDGAFFCIVNDYECALLCDRLSCTRRDLQNRAHAFVVTLGEQGSILSFGGEEISILACHAVSVQDPTGAGDAYRAGFLKGLAHNLPLQTCGKLGAAVASFAVERHGTQEHSFTLSELTQRYEQCFAEPFPLF